MKNGLTILILLATLLAACGPAAATPSPATQESTKPSPTDTSTPTKTRTPASVFVAPTEVPPTPTCFHLLTPENGLSLPADLSDTGSITFSWEPAPEAENYSIDIILPTGHMVNLVYTETSQDIPVQLIDIPGLYDWQVTALRADGSVICSSETFRFGKQK